MKTFPTRLVVLCLVVGLAILGGYSLWRSSSPPPTGEAHEASTRDVTNSGAAAGETSPPQPALRVAASPAMASAPPPGAAATAAQAPANPAASPRVTVDPQIADLPPLVRQQIAQLQEEKEHRTPAEKKMDSGLIMLAKRQRGDAIPPEISNLRLSVEADREGMVLVDMVARVQADLLKAIADTGGVVINSFPRDNAVRARVPVKGLVTIAGREEVRSIRPAAKVRFNTGPVNSQGDRTHGADVARTNWGANGTGVRVGVISDGVGNLATSQANGELGTVSVLSGQAGSGSEGTAMLEIIHDLAPGAQLYFATGTGMEAATAQNIRDLAAAPNNCNIIVDDVGIFPEAPFQDGPVGRAIAEVTANGVLYFSAAGNSGSNLYNTSGTWEGDFVNGGTLSVPQLGTKTYPAAWTMHHFGGVNNSTLLNNLNTITSPDNTGSGQPDQYVCLYWSDPLGGSGNDYDLLILNAAGNTIVNWGTTTQDGTADPVEGGIGANSGEQILVIRNSNHAARFLHVEMFPNPGDASDPINKPPTPQTPLPTLQYRTEGVTRGHNACGAANAFSVAATNVLNTPTGQFPGGSGTHVETFSSEGPRRIFYDTNGSAITPGNFLAATNGGLVLNKPDITAADRVSTSVPGFSPFPGTSAAAPHAAAIAALIRSSNTAIPAAQMAQIINARSLDIEGGGIDANAGNGIIMARLPLPVVSVGTGATSITSSAATLNGNVNPNFSNTTASFQYGLTTSYGSTAPVTLTPVNGGVSQAVSANISGLQADTTYHYRLTATNLGGGPVNTGDNIFRTSLLSVTFTSASTVGVSSAGYTIPNGATVHLALGFVPSIGVPLFVIDNTAPSTTAIVGSFANLNQGSIVGLTYNSVTYQFLVSYAGGDGNDLTLTRVGLPVASVSTTGNVTSGSAQVTGQVNPSGLQTTVVCEYGPTFSGATSPWIVPAGFSSQPVSFTIPTTFQQTVQYRFRATNSQGTTYSPVENITANILVANFASASTVPVSGSAINLTGTSVQVSLNFQPGPLSPVTLVNNTSASPITGTFGNLPNGGTITTSYNGNQIAFIAYYDGGDGNDLVLTRVPATGQKTQYTWDTFAGPTGGDGHVDGPVATSRFFGPSYNGPNSVAAHPDGSVYVSDQGLIRKVTPDDYVVTLVGDRRNPGYQDGPLSQATITYPWGLNFDPAGNLIFIDGHAVRKMAPDGTISTIAGSPTVTGYVDANGASARFGNMSQLTICGGSIYVSSYYNNQTYLRKIASNGDVTTFAGGGANFTHATDPLQVNIFGGALASDGVDKIYLGEYGASTIRLFAPNTSVPGAYTVSRYAGTYGVPGTTTNVPRLQARFSDFGAMTVAANGTLYVADGWGVRKVPVSTTANVTNTGAVGTAGYTDATGTAARFGYILGLAAAKDGATQVFVVHEEFGVVRVINTANSAVTTFAGKRSLFGATNSATPSSARFDGPAGIAWHPGNYLLLSDCNNHGIRKITTAGAVTTAAGILGTQGHVDGAPTSARFQFPLGITIDPAGNVYVADQGNAVVRKMVTGPFTVSRFAGAYDVTGNVDGDALNVARFNKPEALTVDPSGVFYLSDTQYSSIRKISRPTVSAPYTAGTVLGPVGNSLQAIAVGLSGRVYFTQMHSIAEVDPATSQVTTVAGNASTEGWVDGPAAAARFQFPVPEVFDRTQGVFASEWNSAENSSRIRLISLAGAATTVFGALQPRGDDITGAEVELNSVGGIALAPDHSLYVTDVVTNRVIHGSPTFSPFVRLSTGATATGATTAQVNAVVNTNGSPATVYCDLATAPGAIAPSATGTPLTNSASDQNIILSVSGLTSNTIYYYRVRAVNADGTAQTRVGWFKTP